MGIKVSIIIPVFNAEHYLNECIGSLLAQTLRECEFIFINDGSTDSSGSIIERYQYYDNRIKLITQKNQGVSAARNEGLRAAAGEYVGFVDADDYIELDMYERLYTAARAGNCEVVLSNFESELEGHKVVTTYPFPANQFMERALICEQVIPYFLASDSLNTVVNKLYSRKKIMENEVAFPLGVALGEDSLFNMQFFCDVESMIYLNYTGYHYREVIGSATRNIREKDYFHSAIDSFITEPPQAFYDILRRQHVHKLKSIRLIRTTLSYVYIYFKPSNEMNFFQRYSYVRKMVVNKHVRAALPVYYEEMNDELNRYEKFMLTMIKFRLTFGLMCAAAYSRFRNA